MFSLDLVLANLCLVEGSLSWALINVGLFLVNLD